MTKYSPSFHCTGSYSPPLHAPLLTSLPKAWAQDTLARSLAACVTTASVQARCECGARGSTFASLPEEAAARRPFSTLTATPRPHRNNTRNAYMEEEHVTSTCEPYKILTPSTQPLDLEFSWCYSTQHPSPLYLPSFTTPNPPLPRMLPERALCGRNDCSGYQ